MCDKIKENRKPWIIGGVIGVIVLIIVIVLAVTLSDDGNNGNKSNNSNTISNSTDTSDDTVDEVFNNHTNILFIIVDDLGWTDISREGHGSNYSTPNIDYLYDIGIEFTNYYVHAVCTPTRASILTGKYAWRLGLQDIQTMVMGVNQSIPFNTPTVPELLKGLNYMTYYVGKWHIGYAQWEMTPTGRGFDYGIGLLQGRGHYYKHSLSLVGNISGLDFFNLTSHEPYWDAQESYSTDIFYNQTIDYLSNHISGGRYEDNPFYIYLSWQTIHEPMNNPPHILFDGEDSYPECLSLPGNTSGNFEHLVNYCNKMKYLDYKIGNLTEWLKNNSLYNNTLIVLTTDNGGIVHYESSIPQPDFGFFMPQSYGCNYPYRAGKATLFEGGIKAIGLLAGQPIIDLGLDNTQSSLLIHAVDWMATIIEGVTGISNLTQFAEEQGFDSMTSPFDSKNLFDYLGDSEDLFDRYAIYPNADKQNALAINFYENITFDRETHSLVGEYIYDNYTLNGTDNYDCVIWNDNSTNTMWKYIRGLQLYWNYYKCDQTREGDQENLYFTTSEWLFNLTDNPYEYEMYNYLSPNMTNDILISHGLTKEYINNIVDKLRLNITQEMSRGYIFAQNNTDFNFNSLPACNNGAWAPWLDSNGSQFLRDDECESLIQNELQTNLTDKLKYKIIKYILSYAS